MDEFPGIISVDDHVLEPPDLWQSRLAAKYREQGPRVERMKLRHSGRVDHGAGWIEDESGTWCDVWLYGDVVAPLLMLQAAAGFEKLTRDLVTFDQVRPGAWQNEARLADMDLDHIDASVCFPNTLPRFCGQTFLEQRDKHVGLLSVQAYNDWMIDEWSAGEARGRLIPLTIVPLWDVDLAASEIRRCAGKGSHAVSFTESPVPLQLPSLWNKDRYWDPFFAACDETETIICMHVGSSSTLPTTAPDAPMTLGMTLDWLNAVGSLTDYVMSGVLERFPSLKLAYSEGQVGWMPYLLERVDKVWQDFRGDEFGMTLVNPPSTYVRGRVFGCIFDDDTGLHNRDAIGMDQICFETDFPHSQTTWPDSKTHLERMCAKAGLNDTEIYKLARGNAINAFGLSRFGVAS